MPPALKGAQKNASQVSSVTAHPFEDPVHLVLGAVNGHADEVEVVTRRCRHNLAVRRVVPGGEHPRIEDGDVEFPSDGPGSDTSQVLSVAFEDHDGLSEQRPVHRTVRVDVRGAGKAGVGGHAARKERGDIGHLPRLEIVAQDESYTGRESDGFIGHDLMIA